MKITKQELIEKLEEICTDIKENCGRDGAGQDILRDFCDYIDDDEITKIVNEIVSTLEDAFVLEEN